MPNLTLFGAPGSGAVAVEAALTLIGEPYDLIDAITWDADDPQSGDQVLEANPMRQVPALVLPSGEVLTESAALLIWLAEAYPEARLAPRPGAPGRGQFLRWMSFVSASIYSLYWVKDEPSRLAPDRAAQGPLVDRVHERIADCWRIMGAQIRPGRFLLGDEISVLDLYVATVSRFQPRRDRFYAEAPSMAEAVRRVDADPRLAELWAARMPADTG
ncbi:glutathione S-transferase family protein [Phenylobacterium aquaticum]|uniref:glutathione S-transferase family protein n=1 Tax=Phenylobacterium aquaticum TaxID=1763816 RepID=UPI0026F15E94|nr:glutathione S-transferase family protein [Phenylobacterium aquaticum]